MRNPFRRRSRAFGGGIGGPIFPSKPIPLGKGVAVVSDEMLERCRRGYLERLYGGNTVVLSASEALACLQDDAPDA